MNDSGNEPTGPTNRRPAAGGLVPRGTVPSQQCKAHRSNGDPCKRWAIVGGTVCATHGGRAPQVKEAARKRVLALVPLAIEVAEDLLMGLAENPDTGEPVEVPAAVRARVVDSILNRAGVNSPTELDLSFSDTARPDLGEAMQRVLISRGLADPSEFAAASVDGPDEDDEDGPMDQSAD